MRQHALVWMVEILLLVELCGCGGSGNSNDVNVTLSDYSIQSSQTNFTAGTSYHFAVTNKGKVNHEFMIMAPMSGSMSMSQMDQMALYHIDSSALPPGALKAFDFTFPSSQARKPLEFSCHLPGHYEAGMYLTITVAS